MAPAAAELGRSAAEGAEGADDAGIFGALGLCLRRVSPIARFRMDGRFAVECASQAAERHSLVSCLTPSEFESAIPDAVRQKPPEDPV